MPWCCTRIILQAIQPLILFLSRLCLIQTMTASLILQMPALGLLQARWWIQMAVPARRSPVMMGIHALTIPVMP